MFGRFISSIYWIFCWQWRWQHFVLISLGVSSFRLISNAKLIRCFHSLVPSSMTAHQFFPGNSGTEKTVSRHLDPNNEEHGCRQPRCATRTREWRMLVWNKELKALKEAKRWGQAEGKSFPGPSSVPVSGSWPEAQLYPCRDFRTQPRILPIHCL